MSWFKKSFEVAVVLGATVTFGCSGSNQLVGSDGLTVNGGKDSGGSGGSSGGTDSSGGGSRPGGIAPASEPTYQLWQVMPATTTDDERPYLCLPEELPIDEAGNADCYVLSARQSPDCNCAAAGLSPTSDERARTARLESKWAGQCDTSSSGACADLCVCEVDRAVGTSLQQCQTEAEPDANTTGWCYVSAAGGEAQSALVEACPNLQRRRVRFFGPFTEQKTSPSRVTTEALFLGCPPGGPARGMGSYCVSDEEYALDFAGHSVKDVTVNDHTSMCATNVCIQNHFQGRVSCPFGQAQGGTDCLAAGSYDSVAVPVAPQLLARPWFAASICSCQCAGPGPGPFCTCPDYMQCEHLIDEPAEGTNPLAGSYCISQGTQYDPQGDTAICAPGVFCRQNPVHVYN
ncbi:MAG TPA: hypothetical protein VJV79_04650 [Polyangiaceae bacterium]|nr:hypothetical protein [Polyangiaceae bacterium]